MYYKCMSLIRLKHFVLLLWVLCKTRSPLSKFASGGRILVVSVMTHGVSVMTHGVNLMTHGVTVMTHGVSVMTHGVSVMTHGVSFMTYGVYTHYWGSFRDPPQPVLKSTFFTVKTVYPNMAYTCVYSLEVRKKHSVFLTHLDSTVAHHFHLNTYWPQDMGHRHYVCLRTIELR